MIFWQKPNPNRTQNQYFEVSNVFKITKLCITVIEGKILSNFDSCLIKNVLILNFYIFFLL
jgi:hypothetical protein